MPGPIHRCALTSLVLLVLAGCGDTVRTLVSPNEPPTVRITGVPAPSPVPYAASYRIDWIGDDLDGRIDHYLYAINPASVDRVDSTWRSTTQTNLVLPVALPAAQRGAQDPAPVRHFETIAVRAVDDRGAASPPASAAFFFDNMAPIVQITSPPFETDPLVIYRDVPSAFRIDWTGVDPDGKLRGLARHYRWKVFGAGVGEIPLPTVLADPDTLRRRYGPTYAEWDTVAGDSTHLRLHDLEPGRTYVFAVTGEDEVGDADPIFSTSRNLLAFRVTATPGAFAPILTLHGTLGTFTTTPHGDSATFIEIEAPGNSPVELWWSARTSFGASVVSYCWSLHRPGESPPLACGLDTTATIAAGRDTTDLTLEATDSNGLTTTLLARIEFVVPTYDRSLLIVDDTDRAPDRLVPGSPDSIAAPTGGWPSAAELDTFLYAHGGVRWRGYPPGTVSPPGILAGYDFDTLGTHRGLRTPAVSLTTLAQYRHVIWLVDDSGALSGSALRWMCEPGHSNTLAAYAALGGHVWLCGGAAGYASTIGRDNAANNVGGQVLFSSTGLRPDLVAGELMFDQVHWRSEFAVTTGQFLAQAFAGAASRGADAYLPDPAPDYAQLPADLRLRAPGTDPLPPLRQASEFYNDALGGALEYLTDPNDIEEDVDPSADVTALRPTLDTLFVAAGSAPTLGRVPRAAMTYYHGRDNGPVVFSGFAPWDFRRPQCQALVDFVLQQVWGLSKTPSPPNARAQAIGARGRAPRPALRLSLRP